MRRNKILVIEDCPSTRYLIECMLRHTYDLSMAPDSETALSLAEKDHFDLVLLDIRLQKQWEGVEVLGKLRALPSYARVPMVAETAYALPGDREKLIAAGFDDYLSKPFSMKQLKDKVQGALGVQEN